MNVTISSKDSNWTTLRSDLKSLISGEENLIANLSNISSCIFHSLPDLNWCGFYLWSKKDQELVLGPFQGRPACIRIKSGRGVCGKAYESQQTLRVDDVHAFPGHIACDSASNAELVIPLGNYGVLDLDSPKLSRFSPEDAYELESIMKEITPLLRFEH